MKLIIKIKINYRKIKERIIFLLPSLSQNKIKKYILNQRKRHFEKVTISREPALGLKRFPFCYLFHRKFVILTSCLESVVLMVCYFISITGNESKDNY